MNKTNMVLLFVVGILFVITMFFFNFKKNEVENFTGMSTPPREIYVENNFGEFNINTEKYIINDNPVNRELIETILTKLDKIRVIRKLENSVDLKEYGLEEPTLKIELVWPERRLGLEYGGRNPHNQGIYAKFKGSIFILDTFFFHQLNKDLLENINDEVR